MQFFSGIFILFILLLLLLWCVCVCVGLTLHLHKCMCKWLGFTLLMAAWLVWFGICFVVVVVKSRFRHLNFISHSRQTVWHVVKEKRKVKKKERKKTAERERLHRKKTSPWHSMWDCDKRHTHSHHFERVGEIYTMKRMNHTSWLKRCMSYGNEYCVCVCVSNVIIKQAVPASRYILFSAILVQTILCIWRCSGFCCVS